MNTCVKTLNLINSSMMSMNIHLHEVKAFVTVAEQGRITRAAELLQMSQSALSTSIRQLEEKLGLRVFDRHTRMLKLTEFGAEILPVAKRILADLDFVEGSSRELVILGRGRVAIAAPTIQSALWLPLVIERFGKQHPHVHITLLDVPEQEIHGLVRSGAVDIGIATASDVPSDLAVRTFYTDSYVAIVHKNDPLAERAELNWRDLADTSLIGALSDSPARAVLDRALLREGIVLTYGWEVSLPWTMVGLVRARLGIAIVSKAVDLMAEWMDLVVRPISRPVVTRELAFITSRDRSLSPSAHALRDALLESTGELERTKRPKGK